LLLRLEKTSYVDKFILNGVLLISSMIGVSLRTTMDMDTTVVGMPLDRDSIEQTMEQICSFRLCGEMIQDNVECRSPGLHLDPCLGVRAQEIGDEQHDVVSSGVIRGMPVLADDGGEAISVFKHRRLGFSRDVSRVDHDGLLRLVKAHSLE